MSGLSYTPSLDIIFGPMYSGKCLGQGTPVLFADGRVVSVEYVKPRDLLMGDDSQPRRVLSVTTGKSTLYRVFYPFLNESYVVNKEHILSLKHCDTEQTYNLSVTDYLAHPDRTSLKGYKVAVRFPDADVYIDPYLIGKSIRPIPHLYKVNSVSVRMDVLRGFLETKQINMQSSVVWQFSEEDKAIGSDILFIARSLGFNASVNGTTYTILYSHRLLYNINVEEIGIGDYYGFTLDGNHLFVLGDFTVTHNTSEVIRRLIIFHEIGLKVLYLNTLLDTRADEPFSTHNETIGKVPFHSEKVKTLKEVDVSAYDIIAVDEAQFFGDLKEAVIEWVEKCGKSVLVAGLNGDYRREPFGQINAMIPYADTVTKLTPYCVSCIRKGKMRPALFTKRTVSETSEILIGGKEAYIPVCRECYN